MLLPLVVMIAWVSRLAGLASAFSFSTRADSVTSIAANSSLSRTRCTNSSTRRFAAWTSSLSPSSVMRLPRTITSTSGNCCSMVSSRRSCGPSKRTMATSSTTISTRLVAKRAFLQAATEHVGVHMENRLASGLPGIEHQAVLAPTVHVGKLLGGGDDLGQQGRVASSKLGDIAILLRLRHDQQVHGRLGCDIAQRDHRITLEEHFGGYFARDDPGEDGGFSSGHSAILTVSALPATESGVEYRDGGGPGGRRAQDRRAQTHPFGTRTGEQVQLRIGDPAFRPHHQHQVAAVRLQPRQRRLRLRVEHEHPRLRRQRAQDLRRRQVRNLRHPRTDGLLARFPHDRTPPLVPLANFRTLPLDDRPLGRPRDHAVNAELGGDLDGQLVAVALRQGLREPDRGTRGRSLSDGSDGQGQFLRRCGFHGPDHHEPGPVADAQLLARLDAAHAHGVACLCPLQRHHIADRGGGEVLVQVEVGHRTLQVQEAVAQLAEQALLEMREARWYCLLHRGELPDELLRLRVELGRCQHLDADLEVATAVAVEVGDAPILNGDDFGALDAGTDLKVHEAVQRLERRIGAHDRIRHLDLERGQQVIAVATEDVMVTNLDLEVEVTVRAAGRTDFALARHLEADAGVDARRDVHRNLATGANPTLSLAGGARVRDDGVEATAGAAGARCHHVAEQAAHRALDQAAAVTDVTGRRFGSGRATRALAGFAENRGVDLDLLLRAEHDLGQVDLHADQRVLASLAAGPRWRVAAATPAAAEEGFEDVAEAEITAEAALAARVVLLLLLGVAQYVIGVRDLFEPVGGIRPRVHVGVQFTRELAVRLFDLFSRSAALDPEYFIVVSQNLFLDRKSTRLNSSHVRIS